MFCCQKQRKRRCWVNSSLRAGTSVGAHYREGMRSRSDAEFISKLEGGLQELEETTYWLELLEEAQIMKKDIVRPLQTEADELTAIFVTVVKKVRPRRQKDEDEYEGWKMRD